MRLHFAITTIGEPEVHRAIAAVGPHLNPSDTLTVFGSEASDPLAIKISLSLWGGRYVAMPNQGSGRMRNELQKSYPEGEWCLMLDADEILDGYNVELARRAAERTKGNAISLRRINMVYHGEPERHVRYPYQPESYPAYPDPQVRLVRARQAHFVGEVHETFVGPFEECEATILHSKRVGSYVDHARRMVRRFSRNMEWDARIGEEVLVANVYRMGDWLKDKTFVDVGAHIGFASIRACQCNAGRVLAYECHPANYAKLEQNLRLFSERTPIKTHHKAVYRADRPAGSLGYHGFNPTGSDVINTGGGWVVDEATGPYTVETVSIDDVLAEAGDHIGLLKLDCEGSEFPILYTARSLKKVPRIAMEVHEQEHLRHPEFDCTAKGLAAFLQGQGFEVEVVPHPPMMAFIYAKRS